MLECSDHVRNYVAGLVVPQSQQFSKEQVADQDEQDAISVVRDFGTYQERLIPIVEQLRKFTGKDFPIEFERHYRRGLARPNGSISIDFATLKKPTSELALTVAHEWGHHCLGHLTSPIREWDAECQADYWGGIFLGYFTYDLEEVINIKLSMPEVDEEHGTQLERACLIAQGYEDGKQMRLNNVHPSVWPGFEAFKTQFHLAPWHMDPKKKGTGGVQDSKTRKLSK